MKISVVIPNFNDSRIERTLESIVNQSYKNLEIIIVEGCENNTNTRAIYENNSKYISRLIHEKDRGIFDALNKGIKNSTGDIIFLIGSDDKLGDENCFSAVSEYYQRFPNADGFCIGCKFVNSDGKIIRDWRVGKISSSKIKWGLMPPHFSLFLKRKIYDEIHYFDFSETNIGADSEWLLRLAVHKEISIPVIQGHSVLMEQGGTSTGSIKNILRATGVISKAARKYKIPQWFLIPYIKIVSKVFQFKLFKA